MCWKKITLHKLHLLVLLVLFFCCFLFFVVVFYLFVCSSSFFLFSGVGGVGEKGAGWGR